MFVSGLALDSAGHLAVTATAKGQFFGVLYNAASRRRVTGYTIPNGEYVTDITFDDQGDLYASAPGQQEILAYTAEPAAELSVSPAACKARLGSEDLWWRSTAR